MSARPSRAEIHDDVPFTAVSRSGILDVSLHTSVRDASKYFSQTKYCSTDIKNVYLVQLLDELPMLVTCGNMLYCL